MALSGNRLQVLVFIDWYLPAIKAGGPVRSLEAIVSRLSTEVEFTIITGDKDAGTSERLSGIEIDKWTNAPDGTRVYYCSADNDPVIVAKEIIQTRKFDRMYCNSVFSYRFAIRPLLKLKKFFPDNKTILAPRGMLGAGALQIKSARKNMFLAFAKLSGLYTKIVWHVSSEQEAMEVRNVFGTKAKTIVAPNLASITCNDISGRSKAEGQLRLIFISRISPKKNLTLAIRSLQSIRGEVSLDIYGPEEDVAYAAQCKSAAAQLPSNISVRFNGEYNREQLKEIFADKHFMLFPTQHENFGHVIIESLAFACPVIISKFTPWLNLAELKSGMICELNETEFSAAINRAVGLNQSEYAEWERGALQMAKRYLSDDNARSVMLSVFQ
jgi:glycosyltransferase involved in cell wall biosynthesis